MNTSSQPNIDWKPYFQAVRNSGSSATLNAALQALAHEWYKPGPIYALDLGCGEGRDTMTLLRRHWVVNAVDSDQAACQALTAAATQEKFLSSLTVQNASFELANYPKDSFHLVNAYLALPYCPPRSFNTVWSKIVDSVKKDGYICCNLFGPQHTWATLPFVTTVARWQVDNMLKGFDVVTLTETKSSAQAANGATITNHEFFILARKK